MLIYLESIEGSYEQSKFEKVYYQYKDLMYHVAYEVLHNHHDAEDAVINALWAIADNISYIDEPICPKTKHLVVIVTERKAIDIYRRNKRKEAVSYEEWIEKASIDFVAPHELEESNLSLAIAQLPKAYREVILLKYAEGYLTKEIANMLDYSVSKVEKLISRGKKKLEIMLEEVQNEDNR